MYSPELQSKMNVWRQRAAEGTLTPEEMREAIIALRAGRKAAVEAAGTAKRASSSRKPAKSADDLLNELTGL